MGTSKITWLFLLSVFVVAFCAGGWFFSSFLRGSSEVAQLYQPDGEVLGIFDRVPPEDIEAAAAVASAALGQGLSQEQTEPSGKYTVPSQINLTDLKDIAGIAPKEDFQPETDVRSGLPAKPEESLIHLTGAEVTVPAGQDLSALPEQDSKISLIDVPVTYTLIRSLPEYKEFKTVARGSYPSVDFDRQMLIVLESGNDFPDKVFEIQSAEEKDGRLVVSYRVNVFGLDKKTNTHSVVAVDKTQSPVELKQVK